AKSVRLLRSRQMDWIPPDPPVHGISLGRYCHFLLQGIFLTPGWNSHLLHYSYTGGFCSTEPRGKPSKDLTSSEIPEVGLISERTTGLHFPAL
ncbi:unnamed protein product, partial [Rangifer tarandus platyrhynchus]